MSTRRNISIIAIGVCMIAGFLWQKNEPPLSEELVTGVATAIPAPKKPVPVRAPAAAVPDAPVASERPTSVLSATYEVRRELPKYPEAYYFYYQTKKILGAGKEADLISLYVAGGLFSTEDELFNRALQEMQSELDQNADVVAELILKNERGLEEESFIHQMILNLAGNLSVDAEKKAELLGRSLMNPLEFENGDITPSSANVTNALIHMRNSGLSLSEVKPFIDEGIATNTDENSRQEFLARVNTYYPEYFER